MSCMSEGHRNCDIVMKGGITSGIVYPTVVCELSSRYQFNNLGGTSAGALAAALTAAAEYARKTGRGLGPSAFNELSKIPGWLATDSPFGGGSNLFRLFQPQPQTRGLFQFAASFLIKSWPKRLLLWFGVFWVEIVLGLAPLVGLALVSGRPWHLGLLCLVGAFATLLLAATAVPAVMRRFRAPWPVPVVTFAPVALAMFYAWRFGSATFAIAVTLGVLSIFAGVLLSVTIGVAIRLRRIPSLHFGFCTGAASPEPNRPIALVNWLNERINTISGKPPEQPLTFGDLEAAGLNLKTITTCVTLGRPFSMPFETPETFYYSPSEMRLFFPEQVVRWMESCSAKRLDDLHRNEAGHFLPRRTQREPDDSSDEAVDLGNLLPLPENKDLPVIVAARMSMSFPLLFCAVPLYAVDFTRRRRVIDESPTSDIPGGAIDPLPAARKPEAVWFSDGGITSNFPIHLFDAPLPRWPTFGLDLSDVRPDHMDPADHTERIRERVWMPRTNSSGFALHWTRLRTDASLAGVFGFVPAAVNAARNWTGSLQSSAPGYRDRIVHISLDKNEGGLNLNMPDRVQKALAEYGTEAADRLIGHFIDGADYAGSVRTTWDNHRWVRFRSTMAVLGDFLAEFAESFANPEPGDHSFVQLIQRTPGDEPRSYRLTADQRVNAETFAERLAQLGADMDSVMEEGQPKPEPLLRIRPNF